jgi:hypothetical protein
VAVAGNVVDHPEHLHVDSFVRVVVRAVERQHEALRPSRHVRPQNGGLTALGFLRVAAIGVAGEIERIGAAVGKPAATQLQARCGASAARPHPGRRRAFASTALPARDGSCGREQHHHTNTPSQFLISVSFISSHRPASDDDILHFADAVCGGDVRRRPRYYLRLEALDGLFKARETR